MGTFSNEQYSIMKEKLTQAVKDFNYRFKRYEVNYSIAIGHSPENIDLSPLSERIRESDRFIILDHNTCAIVFDFADNTCGIKAANNLLTHFQGTFFSTPLYLGIVTAGNYDTNSKMVHELFDFLDYAIEHNMNSVLVECSQVIQKH